jgi:hypothetical protein
MRDSPVGVRAGGIGVCRELYLLDLDAAVRAALGSDIVYEI